MDDKDIELDQLKFKHKSLLTKCSSLERENSKLSDQLRDINVTLNAYRVVAKDTESQLDKAGIGLGVEGDRIAEALSLIPTDEAKQVTTLNGVNLYQECPDCGGPLSEFMGDLVCANPDCDTFSVKEAMEGEADGK